MQTCSNCGATSRDGAKFCTTCGSRLNEVIDSDAPSGWQSYSESEETAFGPALTDDEVDTEAGDINTSPAEAPPAATSSWSWGQTVDEAPESVAEFETEIDAVAEAESTDSESLSSWANRWSDSAAEDPAPASEPEYEVTADVDEFLESAEEAIEEADSVELESAEELTIADDESVDESETIEVEPDVQSVAAVIASPETSLEHEDSPSPRERAQALVYELRELIDESFDAPEETSSPSSGTVDALATLNGVPAENGQFDNLRSILETAREQPRDVDTMLNLLGEINSLIALVDSHEQLVAAVETAKQQLS